MANTTYMILTPDLYALLGGYGAFQLDGKYVITASNWNTAYFDFQDSDNYDALDMMENYYNVMVWSTARGWVDDQPINF